MTASTRQEAVRRISHRVESTPRPSTSPRVRLRELRTLRLQRPRPARARASPSTRPFARSSRPGPHSAATSPTPWRVRWTVPSRTVRPTTRTGSSPCSRPPRSTTRSSSRPGTPARSSSSPEAPLPGRAGRRRSRRRPARDLRGRGYTAWDPTSRVPAQDGAEGATLHPHGALLVDRRGPRPEDAPCCAPRGRLARGDSPAAPSASPGDARLRQRRHRAGVLPRRP